MKQKGTVELQSSRLLLRRLTTGDAEAMYQNWASDWEVCRYLTWQPHPDVAATKRLLAFWEPMYSGNDFCQWAIVPKKLGQPIGTISVVRWDESTDTAEVGYCIGKPWWHKGYASEALKTVMSFLFEEVGIHRLEARHDTENPASGAVMRNCGLRMEGVLHGAGRNNRGIVDVAVYGILAETYKAKQ